MLRHYFKHAELSPSRKNGALSPILEEQRMIQGNEACSTASSCAAKTRCQHSVILVFDLARSRVVQRVSTAPPLCVFGHQRYGEAIGQQCRRRIPVLPTGNARGGARWSAFTSRTTGFSSSQVRGDIRLVLQSAPRGIRLAENSAASELPTQ